MKNFLLGLIIFSLSSNASSQVGIISGLRKGMEALSVANDAIRTEKAGAKATAKIMSVENTTKLISETEKNMSPETISMITARSVQVLNKCNLNTYSKEKETICKNKSEDFQQCVADQIIQNISVSTSIKSCERFYK